MFQLKEVEFVLPSRDVHVGGHHKVGSRRQGDATRRCSIGQGGTFELLGEESTEETAQPMEDDFFVVGRMEGLFGEEKNLRWTIATS